MTMPSASASFTRVQLDALFSRHETPELEQDLAGTMATVSAVDAMWEMHPLGLRIEGTEAIREMYGRLIRRLFPQMRERLASFDRGTVAYGADFRVHEARYDIRGGDGDVSS